MLQSEIFDIRLHDLIDVNQNLNILVDACEFSEGPIWNPVKEYLTFSDTRRGGRTYRWSEKEGFSTIRPYTNAANGEAYDSEGRILLCEHFTHRVARMNDDTTGYEVMASHYNGKELNSPNDVIVKKSNGAIYFTDPHFGRRQGGCGIAGLMPQPVQGVYRIDPVSKETVLVTDEVCEPNGLAFSPDEKTIYIADTEMKELVVFDVDDNGDFYNKRVFPKTKDYGCDNGLPDGLCIDEQGNIYLAAQGGIHIYTKDGDYLGIVAMPKTVGNLCFGGTDMKSLFVCCSNMLIALKMKIAGARIGIGC